MTWVISEIDWSTCPAVYFHSNHTQSPGWGGYEARRERILMSDQKHGLGWIVEVVRVREVHDRLQRHAATRQDYHIYIRYLVKARMSGSMSRERGAGLKTWADRMIKKSERTVLWRQRQAHAKMRAASLRAARAYQQAARI